jgi:hypothetical protein
MVLGVVLARQCLPSCVCHCLIKSRTRGGTSVLADHLLPVIDLHGAGELHALGPGDTLDTILQGPGDTQLKQQNSVAAQIGSGSESESSQSLSGV